MKLAIIYFKELRKEDLVWVALQAGYDAQIMDSGISIYSVESEDANKFMAYIREKEIECVLTYDFCPALSDGCQACGIPYIAWIYDCPLAALYEDAIRNDCNYIFSFDKRQVDITKKIGAKNVYYQPLGTDISRNAGIIISEDDEKKFSCDVSFIGNLFSQGLFDVAERYVADSVKNEYRTIIENAYGIWDGVDRIHGKLSSQAIDGLININRDEFGENFKMDFDEFFAAKLLAYRLANRERTEMLERLVKYNIRFYTGEKNVDVNGILPRPHLDYMEELPKAYYLSKININTTLHCITHGVPLRVFDIMGVGGFVISNYQPAIEELFRIDDEIVVYRNLDELEDKVEYYLSHEKERLTIAINGYRAVSEKFNNEITLKHMTDTVFSI